MRDDDSGDLTHFFPQWYFEPPLPLSTRQSCSSGRRIFGLDEVELGQCRYSHSSHVYRPYLDSRLGCLLRLADVFARGMIREPTFVGGFLLLFLTYSKKYGSDDTKDE